MACTLDDFYEQPNAYHIDPSLKGWVDDTEWVRFPDCDKCNPNGKVIITKSTLEGKRENGLK